MGIFLNKEHGCDNGESTHDPKVFFAILLREKWFFFFCLKCKSVQSGFSSSLLSSFVTETKEEKVPWDLLCGIFYEGVAKKEEENENETKDMWGLTWKGREKLSSSSFFSFFREKTLAILASSAKDLLMIHFHPSEWAKNTSSVCHFLCPGHRMSLRPGLIHPASAPFQSYLVSSCVSSPPPSFLLFFSRGQSQAVFTAGSGSKSLWRRKSILFSASLDLRQHSKEPLSCV